MNFAPQDSPSAEQKAAELAKEYFRQGLNCTECVLLSFLDTHDTSMPREVIKLASGFGGGIGQTRHICGAITGAALALGTVKGRDPLALDEQAARRQQLQQEVYPPFADLIREVEDHYGTTECAQLVASHGDFHGKERKKSCQQIIAYCAALAARQAAK